MKAEELRIGNWVYFNGVEVKIDLDSFHGIATYDCLDSYNPIPLTKDWLIRFGFEGTELMIAKGNFIYHKGNKTLTWFGVMLLNSLWDEVHKFQNLHFALTGEELELK
jgi:hypothetical protein